MEIRTREQIELHMIMFHVVVAADRSTRIDKVVVKSLPAKNYYGEGEFWMWAMDVKVNDKLENEVSIADMGIDQTPQYNLHATFTTRTEAINYEHTVGIDYDGEDKTVLEFGDDIYTFDDSVDPAELIPFDFDLGEMSPELKEMCIDWSTAMSDESEEVNHDAEVSSKDCAYEHAMKMID